MKKKFVFIYMLFIINPLYSEIPLSLEEVIDKLVLRTSLTRVEILRFINNNLEFNNYKKSFLPALYLNVKPIDYNHSLRLLQNADTGNYSNIKEFSSNSYLGFSIQQKVFLTGGTLTVNNSLSFLREYSYNRNNFTAIPFYVGYTQPILGGRKSNLIERNLNYLYHDLYTKNYCSSISALQQEILSLYMAAYLNMLQKEQNYTDMYESDTLLNIAKLKWEEEYITEYEYNQIELQSLKTHYSYENASRNCEDFLRKLASELEITEKITICKPDRKSLPPILDEDFVISHIKKNNPQKIALEIQRKQAEHNLLQSQLTTRFNGTLSVSYGLNQHANNLKESYRNPNSQQIVSINFSIPVYQWGINRNKKEIAKNEYEATLLEIDKSEQDFDNSLKEQINNYNHAVHLCELSEQSYQLAQTQYHFAIQKFALGQISVYELISTNQEQYTTLKQYYEAVQTLYISYYKLRHLALFDFAQMKTLEEILLTSMNGNK